MIQIRKSEDRGRFDFGWLDTNHTFSFGDYQDAAHMGFSVLRVINEDRIKAGTGFPTHSHKDMEIITYILKGELEHKDSMGNVGCIVPGDVQRMSAGTGVKHSEFNASKKEPCHLLQIWILPNEKGLEPSYEQKSFSKADKLNKWKLVASNDSRQGSVKIHQDASVYASEMDGKTTLTHTIAAGRSAWLHLVKGRVRLGTEILSTGDAAGLTHEGKIELVSMDASELLLFDLPQ